MVPFWASEDGQQVVYHGDARDVLPAIQAQIGVVVTDPPYGIDLDTDYTRFNSNHVQGREYERVTGDETPMALAWLFGVGKKQVVFGANNWPQQLPFEPKRDGWICWDKRTNEAADRILGSPFELAVVIGQRCYEIIRMQHCGVKHADGDRAGRFHPTQKPVKLMVEVLNRVSGGLVCDPFMGSGSTGVACVQVGRPFIGIEIEERYCEIGANRILEERRQGRLWNSDQVPVMKQGGFL